jgi:hypothetical protein
VIRVSRIRKGERISNPKRERGRTSLETTTPLDFRPRSRFEVVIFLVVGCDDRSISIRGVPTRRSQNNVDADELQRPPAPAHQIGIRSACHTLRKTHSLFGLPKVYVNRRYTTDGRTSAAGCHHSRRPRLGRDHRSGKNNEQTGKQTRHGKSPVNGEWTIPSQQKRAATIPDPTNTAQRPAESRPAEVLLDTLRQARETDPDSRRIRTLDLIYERSHQKVWGNLFRTWRHFCRMKLCWAN